MRPNGNPIPAKHSIQNLPKTLSSLLPLCKSLPLLRSLHTQFLINAFLPSVIPSSKLVDAYIHLHSLSDARLLFEQIPLKNSHSWNTIISGYFKSKLFSDVLQLYIRMRRDNLPPDTFNSAFSIKASARESLPSTGACIHCDVLKAGLDLDSFVGPEIVRLYVELGCFGKATKAFDGIPKRYSAAWGAMINACLKFQKESEVFRLFREMKEIGLGLDRYTLVGLVQACASVFAGKEGCMLHGFCIKLSIFHSNVSFRTTIVDMYAKCGLLESAWKLFDEIPEKDVVLWSAVVAGFAQNGNPLEALSFFRQMLEEGIVPNMVTLASVLLACSLFGALRQGRSVHAYVIRNGVELDVVTHTAFVDMYTKCGSISVAHKVFKEIPYHNVYSWSAMINGFGMHGMVTEALMHFTRMQFENQVPNSVTFVAVLSACSHSGRVKEGLELFHAMSRDYNFTPREEHYACMVDLFGRVGQFDEVLSFIEGMPMEPGVCVWGALLGACAIHKRVDLAEIAAKKLLLLVPDQPDVYMQLSNVYARVGMWERVKKIRMMMDQRGLKKNVGLSLIDIV